MKIAWFTPFSEQSAIGAFSSHVTSALADSCEVDLWIDERKPRETRLKTIRYIDEPAVLDSLPQYDFVIYNMGDHLGFHGAIYQVSKRYRGVVILHDRVLHHMFAGYYLIQQRDSWQYLAKMQQHYGSSGYLRALDTVEGRRSGVWEDDEAVMSYPFFEEAITGAEGVVVHSRGHADTVRHSWVGPVGTLFHPSYTANLQRVWDSARASVHRITLLTIGGVNRNKHIDKIIKVLGHNQGLANQLRYLVIGSYEHNSTYVNELRELIDRYSLQETVKIRGYLDDAALRQQIREADVFINLRWPAMEGSSGSLMLQVCTGKPVLVCDTGVYAEIPEGCVLKVNLEDEGSLEKRLISLVEDEGLRRSIGSKARKLAEEFTEHRYATELLQFLTTEVRSCRPILNLCDTVGQQFGWMGATTTMAAGVSREVAALFSDSVGNQDLAIAPAPEDPQ